MKGKCSFSFIIVVTSWMFQGYGMYAPSKHLFSFDRYMALRSRGAALDLWTMRHHRLVYKPFRKELLNCLKNTDLKPDDARASLQMLIDARITLEKDERASEFVLSLLLSRLHQQHLVKLISLTTYVDYKELRNALLQESYPGYERVVDALLDAIHCFKDTELSTLLGLVIKGNLRNYGLYVWCSYNLSRAYDLIGYDGLKAVYKAAYGYEQQIMERAYENDKKELSSHGKVLKFLENVGMRYDRKNKIYKKEMGI